MKKITAVIKMNIKKVRRCFNRITTFLFIVTSLMTIGSRFPAPWGNDFDASKLPDLIYGKYWAMEENNGVANVIFIEKNGIVKLWRYSCNKHQNYQPNNHGKLGEIINQSFIVRYLFSDVMKMPDETHKVSNSNKDDLLEFHSWIPLVKLMEIKVKNLSDSTLEAKQIVTNNKEIDITYKAVSTSNKPLCAY